MKPVVLRAYQLLQVAPWAGRDEVKRAYRERMKLHHPDVHGQDPSRSQAIAELNRAREIVIARH